ncbi:hypothetical protein E4T38_05147 [Aureobasidium subglaciale]|nr:hypothetical protein E4T38_05147 [Aureobasidium subglaciale]KAI5222073.1 hypothetical protein E4T40_05185 [Aureobasidium subglaciale]KAI5225963.1 hypothetical protein E4T41_05004 [Aureobasidium subglaciale]KAI5261960.1 hypothetical protein E4T46_04897 [Aureobasidium subglaciale]
MSEDISSDAPIVSKGPLEQKLNRTIDDFNWDQSKQKVGLDMSDFFEPPYINGHPARLFYASQRVMTILWQINNSPEWKRFRGQLQYAVDTMDGINTMICLGLDQFSGGLGDAGTSTNAWVTQYAVFVYIWKAIDDKWRIECTRAGREHTPVKRIFQDPAFDTRTKYLLQKIPRDTDTGTNTVVDHPEVQEMLKKDKKAFVYAPHLPSRLNPQILSLRPDYFMGNSSKGSGGWDAAMMETYIEESLVNHDTNIGPEVNEIGSKIRLAGWAYQETMLDTTELSYPQHLASMSIFRRTG